VSAVRALDIKGSTGLQIAQILSKSVIPKCVNTICKIIVLTFYYNILYVSTVLVDQSYSTVIINTIYNNLLADNIALQCSKYVAMYRSLKLVQLKKNQNETLKSDLL